MVLRTLSVVVLGMGSRSRFFFDYMIYFLLFSLLI